MLLAAVALDVVAACAAAAAAALHVACCSWHTKLLPLGLAWLFGFSVLGFSRLFAAFKFALFSFQRLAIFYFPFSARRLSSLKTVNCIFIQFSIIWLGSCSSGLCNFQMKYFPNAIRFCANCFLRPAFLWLGCFFAFYPPILLAHWHLSGHFIWLKATWSWLSADKQTK